MEIDHRLERSHSVGAVRDRQVVVHHLLETRFQYYDQTEGKIGQTPCPNRRHHLVGVSEIASMVVRQALHL